MSNIYHIINFIPAFEKEEMLIGYENLANRLVNSGKLRIDAGEKINFARLYIPSLNISLMFSKREIYDSSLVANTKKLIANQLQNKTHAKVLDTKVDKYIETLKKEIAKYSEVPEDQELKLARLIVQSTHPVVIMLILLDNSEVFLSYSHNIGDLLDVIDWHTSGTNSGMQSTNGRDAAVFISCGGDPLQKSHDPKSTYGDGWPAVARLMIIGGQELGHYSDIMRDNYGRQSSRYSANFSGTKAKEKTRIGRINDIARSKNLLSQMNEHGLQDIANLEKSIYFYIDNKVYGFALIKTWLQWKFKIRRFIKYMKHKNLLFIDERKYEKKPATMIIAMVHDMLFNLAPQADVYKSDNKDKEEAIACIEALARVPQQQNKWGKHSTKALMSDLHSIYYQDVIPGCIKAYKDISGTPYSFNRNKTKTSLLYKAKKIFSAITQKNTHPTREV